MKKIKLTKEQLEALSIQSAKLEMTPEQIQAIDTAEQYKLGAEVEYCIFKLGMSPEKAPKEWDLL